MTWFNVCLEFRFLCEKKYTEVMVLRAVSEPILKAEPGTLLETVAGMMTKGIQNSS